MTVPKFKRAERIEPTANKPWADDVLGRQALSGMLSDLVRYEEESFVVSLNGVWGSGKTFFLRRWQQELLEKKWNVLYFNAWEDDFQSDPLVAFVGQLDCYFRRGALRPFVKGVLAAVAPVALRVGLSIANSGLKKLTGVDAAKLKEKDLRSALQKVGCDYRTHRKYVDELRKTIGRLAEANLEKTGRPLVIIVDELDRCRPVFAVGVLERLKHVFNVPHVVFVLGLDRGQLGRTIQSVYGEIDVQNYLRRIIDMDMRLPPVLASQYLDHLWKSMGLSAFPKLLEDNGFLQQEFHDLKCSFSVLAVEHDLSLREVESAVRMFVVVRRQIKRYRGIWPHLVAVMVFLRLRSGDLARRLVFGQCSLKEMVDYLYPKNRDDEVIATLMACFGVSASALRKHLKSQPRALTGQPDAVWRSLERKVMAKQKNFTGQDCYCAEVLSNIYQVVNCFSPFQEVMENDG